jgi:hypothetical protein
MVNTNVDNFKDAYATFADFADYSYKCISYLMDNNETIWKLLKYNGADAWTENDLTHSEKAELINNSQPDSTESRVFMDSGNPDVWVKEICQLRIYPCRLFSENRTRGIVLMQFDFFCHHKINQLTSYQTRVDLGIKELMGTFNGATIAGIGRLHFNAAESAEDKVLSAGQLPFKGKSIYMSNKDV